MEHKIPTYSYYITRIHSLPLTSKRKQTEWALIQLIAQSNDFPQKLIQNLNLQIQNKNQTGSNKRTKQKKNRQPSNTTAQEEGKSKNYSSTLT